MVNGQPIDCAELANSIGQIVGPAFGILSFVWLAIVILMVVSMWVIFSKAGQPGWAAIIPIYNIVVLLQIVGRPIWWIILLLIPFVNIVVMIMVYNDLSKVFGKGPGFTVGLIFLSIIFFPVLAFGNAQYTNPGQQI